MQMGSDRVIEVQPCMIASTHPHVGEALSDSITCVILHAYLWQHVNGLMFWGEGVVVTSLVENMESSELSF